MKKAYLLIAIMAGILAGVYGCVGSAQETDYLSDYSKLEAVSKSNYSYDNSASSNYKGFILDPVVVHFLPDSKSAVAENEGNLTRQDINDLTNYFDSAIIDAVQDSGYQLVYRKGAGIARIRVAITDLRKTNIVFAAVPTARVVTGIGVGGAEIESEILDSVSGKQIAASVVTKDGSRIPFTGLSDWGGAKYAMDKWVSRFRKQLEEMKSNNITNDNKISKL